MYLSPPQFCDTCCSVNINFKDQIYKCFDCEASVGCHPESNSPLGRMANGNIRRLRVQAHSNFDVLWKNGYMSRDRAYEWLTRELNIERESCHIGMLNEEQLRLTITASLKYYTEAFEILQRRKQKKGKQHERRVERTKQRIKARKSKR